MKGSFLGRDYFAALREHYPHLARPEALARTNADLHVRILARWTEDLHRLGSDAPNRFQKLSDRSFSMNRNVWRNTGLERADYFHYVAAAQTYKGLLNLKPPGDLVLYSSLIWELQPKTIIEFGSFQGGSSLWFADQLEAVCGTGEVHSYELLDKCIHPLAVHPRLTFHRADLRDLSTLDRHLWERLPHPWIVVDDAHENLQQLLPFVVSFMHRGDYYVLEDIFADYATPATIAKAAAAFDALGLTIDSKYTDAFGYNVTASPNSWLRKC
jgi:cephalosporin hydroxylase